MGSIRQRQSRSAVCFRISSGNLGRRSPPFHVRENQVSGNNDAGDVDRARAKLPSFHVFKCREIEKANLPEAAAPPFMELKRGKK
jgi:hypothetical protein